VQHRGKPADDVNSISASQRRCRRRLRSVTELPPQPFEFEREIQGFLMLKSALLVAISQARIHQAQVEARFFRILTALLVVDIVSTTGHWKLWKSAG
jgi:hypothetical protein